LRVEKKSRSTTGKACASREDRNSGLPNLNTEKKGGFGKRK